MKCKRAQEYVAAFVDGELTGRLYQAFVAHWERCERCQGVVAWQRRIKALIGERVVREKAPPHLKDRIRDDLHDQE